MLTLWMPPVQADNASTWPTVSTATLETGGARDVVRLRDRNGAHAGELQFPPGDGEQFLRRLGLQPQLSQP